MYNLVKATILQIFGFFGGKCSRPWHLPSLCKSRRELTRPRSMRRLLRIDQVCRSVGESWPGLNPSVAQHGGHQWAQEPTLPTKLFPARHEAVPCAHRWT
jgi:hypothetical protein